MTKALETYLASQEFHERCMDYRAATGNLVLAQAAFERLQASIRADLASPHGDHQQESSIHAGCQTIEEDSTTTPRPTSAANSTAPMQPSDAATAQKLAVDLMIRDVCEQEPIDPDDPDAVTIDVNHLRQIIEHHWSQP